MSQIMKTYNVASIFTVRTNIRTLVHREEIHKDILDSYS